MTAIVIDEINSFKYRKGNGHRANFKGHPGKTCSKCNTSHPLREWPVWGKKCHNCGNKNNFSMCCRSGARKDSQDRDQCRLIHRESHSKRRSSSRCRRYASEDLEDRSRSRSTTQSAHSIEQNSFKTILNSMTDYPIISMGDTPLKVMILSRRHFTLFPGQCQWLASAMIWIKMAKPRSSQS